MPRPKRNSQIIEKAQRRLEALQSIEPDLDFGNNLSITIYAEQIEQTRRAIAHYNTLLSTVDEAQAVVEALEKQVSTLSTRLLKNVGARYGEDSLEYMKAGGKIRRSRKQVVNPLSHPWFNSMETPISSRSTPLVNDSSLSMATMGNTQVNGKKTKS
jgi:hypothetical protein